MRALPLMLLAATLGAGCADGGTSTPKDDPIDDTEPSDTDAVVDETDETDEVPPDTDEHSDEHSDGDTDDSAAPFDTHRVPPPALSFAPYETPQLSLAGITPGTWWVPDLATWADLLGSTPPATLVAGTHGAVVWYGGDRPWLQSHAEVRRAVSYSPDTITLRVRRVELDPTCDVFELLTPVVAIALVPLQPVSAVSSTVRSEAVTCAAGGAEGASCTLDEPCLTGGLCAAATQAPEAGVCVDATQRGVFDAVGGGLIADDGEATELTFAVTGLATVALDAVLELDVDHPRPTDLLITLALPDDEEPLVVSDGVDHPGGLMRRVVLGVPADESMEGTWTLRVTDRVTGEVGRIDGARLELLTQWD